MNGRWQMSCILRHMVMSRVLLLLSDMYSVVGCEVRERACTSCSNSSEDLEPR